MICTALVQIISFSIFTDSCPAIIASILSYGCWPKVPLLHRNTPDRERRLRSQPREKTYSFRCTPQRGWQRGVCRLHCRPQSVIQVRRRLPSAYTLHRKGCTVRQRLPSACTVDRKGVPPYKRRFLLGLPKATRFDLFSVNKTGRKVCMNAQRHEKSLSIMTGVGDEATVLFLLLSRIRDSKTTGSKLFRFAITCILN